jgi:hypothetical protein
LLHSAILFVVLNHFPPLEILLAIFPLLSNFLPLEILSAIFHYLAILRASGRRLSHGEAQAGRAQGELGSIDLSVGSRWWTNGSITLGGE